jgi:hypothetical protein
MSPRCAVCSNSWASILEILLFAERADAVDTFEVCLFLRECGFSASTQAAARPECVLLSVVDRDLWEGDGFLCLLVRPDGDNRECERRRACAHLSKYTAGFEASRFQFSLVSSSWSSARHRLTSATSGFVLTLNLHA